jgi:hypothetical protein
VDSHGSGDAGFHGLALQEARPVGNQTGDAYAKRVLLTTVDDAISRGVASNLAKHGCR